LIRQGPKICFWCGTEIPYTIHDTYWYCFTCGRFTDNETEGRCKKGEHACIHQVINDESSPSVMIGCKKGYCTKVLILSQREYQIFKKKTEEQRYVHSAEFHG